MRVPSQPTGSSGRNICQIRAGRDESSNPLPGTAFERKPTHAARTPARGGATPECGASATSETRFQVRTGHRVALATVRIELAVDPARQSGRRCAVYSLAPFSTSDQSIRIDLSSESRTEQYFVTASSIARSVFARSMPSPSTT